jgi:hypothetical protein
LIFSNFQYGILSVAIFNHMNKITRAYIIVMAFLPLSCTSGAKKGSNVQADGKPAEIPGNISFVFPPSGYAHDHRNELIQACLDGITHDLGVINEHAFSDTFTIQFLESRQEMKLYSGMPASGVALLQPQKIVYYVINEKEKGAPIDHELMHMISQSDWGYPDRTSLWMNEGLAAFSQNSCNGYNDEQIYRYFAASNMLLQMDSLVNQFYQEPEMIAYHQAGCIVQHLLRKYGVEKFRDLWHQGFYSFQSIYGLTFPEVLKDIENTAKKDYPAAPEIIWTKFSEGCQ